jgi:hypothetical protein
MARDQGKYFLGFEPPRTRSLSPGHLELPVTSRVPSGASDGSDIETDDLESLFRVHELEKVEGYFNRRRQRGDGGDTAQKSIGKPESTVLGKRTADSAKETDIADKDDEENGESAKKVKLGKKNELE